MVSLREIRSRIHSVDNIKQITKAMELVAGAEFQKAEAKALQSNVYVTRLTQILQKLIASESDFKHPLLIPRETKKTVLIVIGGDRGLCGSYNANIFLAAEKFLKRYSQNAVELVLFGNKMSDHYQRRKWKIRESINNWSGKITFEEVAAFTQKTVDEFISKEYDEVWIIYTAFHSLLSRKIKTEKLLNIEFPKKQEESGQINYIMEPFIDRIYHEILPRYLTSKLMNALDDSHASEIAARIFSMKTATKNAEDLIERLTLERNKLRQANITREITEIINGAGE